MCCEENKVQHSSSGRLKFITKPNIGGATYLKHMSVFQIVFPYFRQKLYCKFINITMSVCENINITKDILGRSYCFLTDSKFYELAFYMSLYTNVTEWPANFTVRLLGCSNNPFLGRTWRLHADSFQTLIPAQSLLAAGQQCYQLFRCLILLCFIVNWYFIVALIEVKFKNTLILKCAEWKRNAVSTVPCGAPVLLSTCKTHKSEKIPTGMSGFE